MVTHISHVLSQFVPGGDYVYVTTPGEDSWKLASGIFWTLHHASPLLIVLYPFAAINLSYKYDHVLSPASSRESPNLEVVLGSSNIWKALRISTWRFSSTPYHMCMYCMYGHKIHML